MSRNDVTSFHPVRPPVEVDTEVPTSMCGEAPGGYRGHRIEAGLSPCASCTHSGPGASLPAKVCAHTPTQGHPRTQAGQE